MSRNFIVISLFVFLLTSSCMVEKRALNIEETLLQKSCAFLWNQQSADGGWHSMTHGILRGGESISPFILYTLLNVPSDIYKPPPTQLSQGLDFIRKHINDAGVVGKSDADILDYPNYATAHALLVLSRMGLAKDTLRIKKMQGYLLTQQFVEHRRFKPTDLPYGGWGFGEDHLPEGKTGHVDLSHTRRILQALQGHDQLKEIQQKARFYFRLTQKHRDETRLHPTNTEHQHIPYDGGFFASPVTLSTNKGGIAFDDSLQANFFRSYATATCDGILGLIAAGYDLADEPIQSAYQWLENHPSFNYPEGIPLNDPDQWHEVMFYYHLAVRAEVYGLMNASDHWKEQIVFLLSNRQQPDGHFFNPMGGPNKEDDPLLATSFAIIALTNTLSPSI